jgi:dihydrodipicolinate synthase/N-acetylneuraminate lyase
MGGLDSYTDEDLIKRTRKIAEIIPVFGFYLQPAVGGRILPYSFWKQFVEIKGVYAIKVAAFNRYQTLDVVRAVIESERNEEIALYTGNDDNIINDLLTPFRFKKNGEIIEKRFVGGLLGQWAVWTSKAVEMLNEIKKIDGYIPAKWLTRNAELTDANAAIFDAANNFEGCIPGIHEILRRQGLLEGRWCLNPSEKLSPDQKSEIDRVYESYPHLNDDQFVKERLDDFLK